MKDNDNLTIERPTFVTHLECAMEGDHYPADQIHNLSKAGKPLLVRYDLAGVKKALTKDALAQRPADLWRYRELLPVRKVSDIVSLGEVMTPLIRLPKLSKKIGGGEIIVKDEGRLPTGSFKARGLVMAVSMAKALGIKHMAMPTNGNAGAALAAYASSLRHQDHDLLSRRYAGGECQRDRTAGRDRLSRQRADRRLRQDRRGRQGQGRLVRYLDAEGALSDRRQEDDGAGTCRATRLGRAGRDLLSDRRRHRPDRHVEGVRRTRGHRLHRQQATTNGGGAGCGLCADGARIRERNRARAALGKRPHHRIGHPGAAGGRRFSHPSRGAREQRFCHRGERREDFRRARTKSRARKGLLLCPEGAATYAAYKQSLADGRVSKNDRVMLFNCATGLKYPLPPVTRTLDRHQPIDYTKL